MNDERPFVTRFGRHANSLGAHLEPVEQELMWQAD